MMIHCSHTEVWPVGKFIPHPRNPNKHPASQIALLGKIITAQGWRSPICVSKRSGFVIKGHGRLAAAMQAGLKEAPVDLQDYATEADEWADMIADNRLAELAEIDLPQLKDLLQELDTGEIDMDLTGFDADALAGLMLQEHQETDGDAEAQTDRAAELNKKWQVKPGDLWRIGEHRLLCGDCTKRGDVDLVLAGEKPDLCLTDPPYGLGNSQTAKNDYNDYNDTPENLKKLVSLFLPIAREVTPVVVLSPGVKNNRLYPDPTWTLCWFSSAGVGRGPWGFCCWQPLLAYGKDPKLAAGGGSYPDSYASNDHENIDGHPCAKPTIVWEWFMKRCTAKDGATLYEPFCGSGTTMVVSQRLGHKCLGIEISPDYCAVILQRMADAFPGIKIERDNG